MASAKRTVEIGLPSLRTLASRQVLGVVAFLVLIGALLYWRGAVHSYFQEGVIAAPMIQIVAEEDAKIETFSREEGEEFQRGEQLVVLRSALISAQQAEIRSQERAYREQIERAKQRLGQAMQSYVAVQSQIEMGVSIPEVLESSLAEIREAQQQQAELETKLFSLAETQTRLDQQSRSMSPLAPFEGIVLRRYKSAGDSTQRGDPILLISEIRQRYIEAFVDEGALGAMMQGTEVKIEFPSHPGKIWRGTIASIRPLVEEGKVRIRIKAEDLPLQVGLKAQIRL
jgi:membrane fusion protein (multidrug efflux system)